MNDRTIIRVVIAEGQEPCRRIRSLLKGTDDIVILAEATTANAAIDATRQHVADIMLVEHALLSDPPMAPSLAERASPARVLVMLDSADRASIIEAFRSGADGVVLRTSSPETLSHGIRSTVNGSYWPAEDVVQSLVEALRESVLQSNNAPLPASYRLTRRELDIIAKIVRGRSNREVSVEFSISERTVKHHLTNIFDKLGVTSRLQLALFAVSHRLTES
jgi:two-component system nitrate/nitrite response regulator NarL